MIVNYYGANGADIIVVQTQQYFQKLRKLEELNVHDGVAMGEACAIVMKDEKAKARQQGVSRAEFRLTEVFSLYRALREFAATFPFFLAMMVAVVRNKFGKAPYVSSKLADLDEVEGKDIG